MASKKVHQPRSRSARVQEPLPALQDNQTAKRWQPMLAEVQAESLKQTPLYRLLHSINVPEAALGPTAKHLSELRDLADEIRSTTGLVPRTTSFGICTQGRVHETYVPAADDVDYDDNDRNHARGWRYDYLEEHPELLVIADVEFTVLDGPGTEMVVSVISADEVNVTLAARYDGERHGPFRNADEDGAG